MSTAITPTERVQALLHMGFPPVQIAAILDADVAEIQANLLDPTDEPTLYLGA